MKMHGTKDDIVCLSQEPKPIIDEDQLNWWSMINDDYPRNYKLSHKIKDDQNMILDDYARN